MSEGYIVIAYKEGKISVNKDLKKISISEISGIITAIESEKLNLIQLYKKLLQKK